MQFRDSSPASARSGSRLSVTSGSGMEHVMVTNRTVVPRRAKTQDTVSLTNWQKVIGVCLLLFYLAMIVITIATLPYVANVAIPHLTIFVP